MIAGHYARMERLSAARMIATHTQEQWLAIRNEFGSRCVRCWRKNKSLVKDHIIPLCSGGSDGIENLQPICKSCNSSKVREETNWLEYRRAIARGEDVLKLTLPSKRQERIVRRDVQCARRKEKWKLGNAAIALLREYIMLAGEMPSADWIRRVEGLNLATEDGQ